MIDDTNLVSSACVMDFGAPVPVDMETIALRRDDHVPGRLALDQNRGLRVRAPQIGDHDIRALHKSRTRIDEDQSFAAIQEPDVSAAS